MTQLGRIGERAARRTVEPYARHDGACLVENLVEAPPRVLALARRHGQQGAGRQSLLALDIVELFQIVQGDVHRRAVRVLGRRRRKFEHGAKIVECRLALVQGGADARQHRARLAVAGCCFRSPHRLVLGGGEITELQIDRGQRDETRQ